MTVCESGFPINLLEQIRCGPAITDFSSSLRPVKANQVSLK